MNIAFSNSKTVDFYEETGNLNVDLQVEGVDQWVNFKRDPSSQLGMKFVDSMVLATYIEEEAYQGGELPELEGATVRVSPEGLDYSLA